MGHPGGQSLRQAALLSTASCLLKCSVLWRPGSRAGTAEEPSPSLGPDQRATREAAGGHTVGRSDGICEEASGGACLCCREARCACLPSCLTITQVRSAACIRGCCEALTARRYRIVSPGYEHAGLPLAQRRADRGRPQRYCTRPFFSFLLFYPKNYGRPDVISGSNCACSELRT